MRVTWGHDSTMQGGQHCYKCPNASWGSDDKRYIRQKSLLKPYTDGRSLMYKFTLPYWHGLLQIKEQIDKEQNTKFSNYHIYKNVAVMYPWEWPEDRILLWPEVSIAAQVLVTKGKFAKQHCYKPNAPWMWCEDKQ